jgi:Ca2+-transporting ATPase
VVLSRDRGPTTEPLEQPRFIPLGRCANLTENRMAVRKISVGDALFDVPPGPAALLPEEAHPVVEYGILASQRDPCDPMEKAFKSIGEHRLAGTERLHPSWTLVRQYPLSEQLLSLSHVWRSPDGEDFVIAAKGAPEATALGPVAEDLDGARPVRSISPNMRTTGRAASARRRAPARGDQEQDRSD